jgi:hypothetical protein
MRAEDRILTPQMCADTDGNRFLPNVSMTRAVDESALMRFREPLFAGANELHLAIER